MAEHKLLHKWIPMLKSVDLLHEQSPLKKLIHIKVDLFMPFSNRDKVVEGTGFMLPEIKAAGFVMKSDHSGSFYGTEFDSQCEKRVRMNLKDGFMYMERIDENSCKFKAIINVDMEISLTQGWVGKWVMNKVVKVWLTKIAKQSENFKDTEFAKRLMINPVYRFCAKRLGIEFPDINDVLSGQ